VILTPEARAHLAALRTAWGERDGSAVIRRALAEACAAVDELAPASSEKKIDP
jgi:hypothetical protein